MPGTVLQTDGLMTAIPTSMTSIVIPTPITGVE